MNTKERILQYADFKGLSNRGFSKKILASPTYLTTTKSIGSDILEKIGATFPDLNMDWVVTGKGEMLNNPEIKKSAVVHYTGDLDADIPGPFNPEATEGIMQLDIPLDHKVVMLRERVGLLEVEVALQKKLIEAQKNNIEKLQAGNLVK